MSSIPGYTLEKYVAWNHNLIVQGLDETNVSVGMAESLGLASHQRSVITEEQFAKIVRIYEPHREAIENWLDDFDEEHQSWRDYSGYREDLTNGEFMNVVLLIEAFQRPFPLMSPLDQQSYWFSRDTKVPNGRMSSALEVNFRERAQILYEFCDLARKADYHAFFEGITLVTLQEFRIPDHKDQGASLVELINKSKPKEIPSVKPTGSCDCKTIARYVDGDQIPMNLWGCTECRKRFFPADDYNHLYKLVQKTLMFFTKDDLHIGYGKDGSYAIFADRSQLTSYYPSPFMALEEWYEKLSDKDVFRESEMIFYKVGSGLTHGTDRLIGAVESIAQAIKDQE